MACNRDIFTFFYLCGFLPGGSGATIRHNTQITHMTQNNTMVKRNATHKTAQIMKDMLGITHSGA
jgi:hypothetical protein